MTAPTWTAREVIDASLSASRAAVEAERERAQEQAELEGLAPQEAIPATPQTEAEFRAGLVAVYGIARKATMHDLYTRWEVGRYLSTALDNCKWGSAGKLIQDLYDDPSVFFRWKKSHVYSYAQLGREEWAVVAKSGSAKKALEDMRDRNRTDAERKERKERKSTMRTKERGYLQEIHVQGCQLDEQSKRIRELEEENRLLRGAADPAKYKAMEECLESHALAERMAYKKLDLSEALAHTYKSKLERQGRELGAARVALAARPPTNGNAPFVHPGGQIEGNGNGATNGSAPLLSIGENRGAYVDPGEQA